MMSLSVDAWWLAVEDRSAKGQSEPMGTGSAAQRKLADLHNAAMRFDLARAGEFAAVVREQEVEGPWDRVRSLLLMQLRYREGRAAEFEPLLDELVALMDTLSDTEQATRARALHLAGSVSIKSNRFRAAEKFLAGALALIGDGVARHWVLDGMAQAFLARGAWVEGIRTLRALVDLRKLSGDHLGVAISGGHLGSVELQLGRPARSLESLREVIDLCSDHIEARSLLRLRTFALQAALECDLPSEASKQASEVERLIEAIDDEAHYLVGYAAVALARQRATVDDRAEVARRLDQARASLQLPDQLAIIRYWESVLTPETMERDGWWASMREAFEKVAAPTEAELLTRLALADRAAASGANEDMMAHLLRAFDLSVAANNPLWSDRVGRVFERLAPREHAERVLQRFSGSTIGELSRTTEETVTMIFADLAGFTARSQTLAPGEVMETVRSLFELAVPIFEQNRVRPLQYLGDGLLAIAQGPGHGERGLRFALDLVRRADRVTQVRRTLGEPWGFDLRAGVASGPVVLGPLGTSHMTSYLAIGRTTNLAARLQGQARPGEVVCAHVDAELDDVRTSREQLELKGFTEPVEAQRILGPEV